MRDARQKQIIDKLVKTGSVKTSELVEEFNVSIETIRRDFKELEREGVLKKTYGGAILAASKVSITELEPWQERTKYYQEEKSRIAQAAVRHVHDGMTVSTESGTTMFELAKYLNQKKNLTVITNDIYVAQEMFRNQNNSIYFLGGQMVLPGITVGELAKEVLNHFASIDLCFFSTDGLTLEKGLTTSAAFTNELKKQMMKKAAKKIALVDHSKFGKNALFRTCFIDEIDLLITDSLIPKDILARIREKGIPVEIIPAEPEFAML